MAISHAGAGDAGSRLSRGDRWHLKRMQRGFATVQRQARDQKQEI
jgi:hypothetical protein